MGKVLLVDIINSVNEIPPFPQQYEKILALIEQKNITAEDIGNEIMKDQGLTVKVLKMANSVYYGMSKRVDTVPRAIIVLGFKGIKSIVLTSAVSKSMKGTLSAYDLEQDEFWKQSLVCAYTARLIAKEISYKEVDQAYTTGLLRDIGKIIADKYLVNERAEMIRLTQEENKTIEEAEFQILGFTNPDIGSKLAQRWRLPDQLVEAIGYHHNFKDATINPKLVGITSLADAITTKLWENLENDHITFEFSKELLAMLDINDDLISTIVSNVKVTINSGELFFDM